PVVIGQEERDPRHTVEDTEVVLRLVLPVQRLPADTVGNRLRPALHKAIDRIRARLAELLDLLLGSHRSLLVSARSHARPAPHPAPGRTHRDRPQPDGTPLAATALHFPELSTAVCHCRCLLPKLPTPSPCASTVSTT